MTVFDFSLRIFLSFTFFSFMGDKPQQGSKGKVLIYLVQYFCRDRFKIVFYTALLSEHFNMIRFFLYQ